MRRKVLFALPNLFTLTSIAFGVYAIITAAAQHDPSGYKKAAIAIIFGFFCDGLDGRVARLTKTQSEFGLQLDSIADVVTFGVAPAILVYQWGLSELGIAGIAGAILYTICGALRLARFNVLAKAHTGVLKHFTGMPIPAAAGMITTLVLMISTLGDFRMEPLNVLVFVIVLSYLMVSNIRYRTFKDVRPNPKTFAMGIFVLFAVAFTAMKTNVPVMMFCVGSIYTGLGLVEEVVFFKKRRLEEQADEEEHSPKTV
jgi:CDP-diacylglycerol--serine O-phosphatidyltransferase